MSTNDVAPTAGTVELKTPIWRAKCGVCLEAWKVESVDNPAPHRSFCPDCRKRGLTAPGVLTWEKDATSIRLPQGEGDYSSEEYGRLHAQLVETTAALAASEAKLAETADGIVLAHGCNVLAFEEMRGRAEMAEAKLAASEAARAEAEKELSSWKSDHRKEALRANRAEDRFLAAEASPRPAENAGEIGVTDEMIAELRRLIDHFGTWASDHSDEATAETWAALHCARKALATLEAARNAARPGEIKCQRCDGEQWVCEAHPDKAWGGASTEPDACHCGAPGAPCSCNPLYRQPDLVPDVGKMVPRIAACPAEVGEAIQTLISRAEDAFFNVPGDQLQDAIDAARAAINTQPEETRELVAHAFGQCNKHVNGMCSLRKCLVRGGWKLGDKTGFDLATCPELETGQALARAALAPRGAPEGDWQTGFKFGIAAVKALLEREGANYDSLAHSANDKDRALLWAKSSACARMANLVRDIPGAIQTVPAPPAPAKPAGSEGQADV